MIKYGISEHSVIPVRREPSERSEMTTQVLFGETFQILEETVKWSYIKLAFDNYLGWIDNKCISYMSADDFNQFESNNNIIVNTIFCTCFNQKKEQVILPAGSTLPNYNKIENIFIINENKYYLPDDFDNTELNITFLTRQFLNSPYLWGGKNPLGIDCSGFTQVIYKIFHKKLPRNTQQQVNIGETVNFISDVQPGDLAFFDNSEGDITHVGIILNKNEIIHASGKVRIDKIDQQGIFNQEIKKYTHHLRVIKRLL